MTKMQIPRNVWQECLITWQGHLSEFERDGEIDVYSCPVCRYIKKKADIYYIEHEVCAAKCPLHPYWCCSDQKTKHKHQPILWRIIFDNDVAMKGKLIKECIEMLEQRSKE